MSKFVFVTGGLIENVGKGVTASALARLLKNSGLKVDMLKVCSYLNIDPGTMSPYQHGEVFVTEDGSETDLDLGNYERFLDEDMSRKNYLTGGMVYSSVINKERLGKYVGSTVRVIPQITSEIKDFILNLSNDETDIVIVELSGTTSDYENGVYLQAIKQLVSEIGNENVFLLHMGVVPKLETTGEVRIEILENSVQRLNTFGLVPDAIVCRTVNTVVFTDEVKRRIARRCSLANGTRVIHVQNLDTIYEVPIILQNEGLDQLLFTKFNIDAPKADLNTWEFMVKNFKENYPEIRFCVVGKYTKVNDAYLSIEEAIKHACTYNQVRAKIDFIDAEDIEEYGVEKFLKGAKAIIVPPGWGSRGVNGMLTAVQYARENKIPFLGIGLGMQMAVIEFARNVIKYESANTTEIDPNTEFPVIDVMEEQKAIVMNGKTMRLGSYDCVFDPNSKSQTLYGQELISERHRHRYEFNSKYHEKFEENGMTLAGMNPQSKLIEIIELQNHPFFVGVTFEPECKSRPNKPHPLFLGLVNTAKSVRS